VQRQRAAFGQGQGAQVIDQAGQQPRILQDSGQVGVISGINSIEQPFQVSLNYSLLHSTIS
jgi:hypothetical protein